MFQFNVMSYTCILNFCYDCYCSRRPPRNNMQVCKKRYKMFFSDISWAYLVHISRTHKPYMFTFDFTIMYLNLIDMNVTVEVDQPEI